MTKRKLPQREQEYIHNIPKPIGYVIIGGIVRGIFPNRDITNQMKEASQAESDSIREYQDVLDSEPEESDYSIR